MNIATAIVRVGASAEISVAESVLLSLLGFALVFVVLIVLILVIKLITGATGKIESNAKKADEAAALAKAAATEKAAAAAKEAAVVNTVVITDTAADVTIGTVTPSAEIIAAPIQGTVFEINVAVGQTIKKGSLLVVIEAMYMENEVLAQREGTVSQIICKVGENVNVAAPLIVLI